MQLDLVKTTYAIVLLSMFGPTDLKAYYKSGYLENDALE